MHEQLSDKALLEKARKGDDAAGSTLIRRFLGSHGTGVGILTAWRRAKFLTVNAAKKIALRS